MAENGKYSGENSVFPGEGSTFHRENGAFPGEDSASGGEGGTFGPIERTAAGIRVRDAARRGTLSHALLLSGGGDLTGLARYAAAAMECTADLPRRPCGVCAACRKVRRDIHPDVITVRDEGHKNLSAAVIRSVRQDVWVQPNEGRRKVCLFPDCALLTEQDQNLLLKVVEDGPPYAAFLFCAENPSSVLQTLRSRCVELRLRGGPDGGTDGGTERRGGTDGVSGGASASGNAPGGGTAERPLRAEGEALCRAGVQRRGAVAEWAAKLERKKPAREDLGRMLAWCAGAFAAALLLPYGRPPEAEYRDLAPFLAKSLTKRQTASIIELLKTYGSQCDRNIGTGHVLGALAAEWEALS